MQVCAKEDKNASLEFFANINEFPGYGTVVIDTLDAMGRWSGRTLLSGQKVTIEDAFITEYFLSMLSGFIGWSYVRGEGVFWTFTPNFVRGMRRGFRDSIVVIHHPHAGGNEFAEAGGTFSGVLTATVGYKSADEPYISRFTMDSSDKTPSGSWTSNFTLDAHDVPRKDEWTFSVSGTEVCSHLSAFTSSTEQDLGGGKKSETVLLQLFSCNEDSKLEIRIDTVYQP